MIPQTRTDLFLAKITGEDVALPVPQTRFELYLANCAGESYELPAPNSRATLYLAKILGQDVALPVPQTRSELYLASIAGMSVQLPEAPTTREEWYLAKWAEDAGYVTITGNPVTFSAVAAKLRQLKIEFSPVQEGSGDPSPENERPIRGWTGVNVWQRGKNLFDADTVYASYKQDDGSFLGNAYQINQVQYKIPAALVGKQLTFSMYIRMPNGSAVSNARVMATEGGVAKQGDPYVTSETYTRSAVTFTPTSTADYVCFNYGNGSGNIQIRDIQLEIGASASEYEAYSPDAAVYHVSFPVQGKNLMNPAVLDDPVTSAVKYTPIYVGDGKFTASSTCPYAGSNAMLFLLPGNVQTGASSTTNGVGLRVTRTVDSIDGYITIGYRRWDSQGTQIDPRDYENQLEAGATATAYEPFAYAVYSGYVNVLTWDGVNDMAAVDMGDLAWSKSGSSWKHFDTAYALLEDLTTVQATPTVCELYASDGVNFVASLVSGHFCQYGKRLYFRDDTRSEMTVAEWKAYVTGKKLALKLAEPIPFHVDPQQINSLAGTNNMWTDADTLTVEYRKDGNVSDAEALSMLLGGRYTPATGPEDVSDSEALSIIAGGKK